MENEELILKPLRAVRIELPDASELKDYKLSDFKSDNKHLAKLRVPNYDKNEFELVFPDFDKNCSDVYFIILVFHFYSPLRDEPYSSRVDLAAKYVGAKHNTPHYETLTQCKSDILCQNIYRFLEAQQHLAYKSLSEEWMIQTSMKQVLQHHIHNLNDENFDPKHVVSWKDSIMQDEPKLYQQALLLYKKVTENKDVKKAIRNKAIKEAGTNLDTDSTWD